MILFMNILIKILTVITIFFYLTFKRILKKNKLKSLKDLSLLTCNLSFSKINITFKAINNFHFATVTKISE